MRFRSNVRSVNRWIKSSRDESKPTWVGEEESATALLER
ncbi:hypothetical protein LINPERPRIM_LOCUS40799, partial [Linum perenne]